MTTGHSAAFALFHRAILARQPMTCSYKGHLREVCPHILGHGRGREKALVYQYAGESSSYLPPGGEWRCFELSEVTDIVLHNAGLWHTGRGHSRTQHCVDRVFIDVNESVPNQPCRRR